MAKHSFGPSPTPNFEVYPTPDEVAFFKENGFLAIERLTTDEEIAWLRQIMEFIFDPANAGSPFAPVDRSGDMAQGEVQMLGQSFFPEVAFKEILDASFRRNAKRYAAALLDVEEERLSGWGHMIRKPPGGREVSWHQDHAYWQPELDYLALGCWVPLHDVTVEMGAMQFIPGSHKLGLLKHRHIEKPENNLLTADEPFDRASAVACPLKAGGATFHHSETLHFTAQNTTQTVRLAFPTEFQVAPVRRQTPEKMPWVDQLRAATGAEPAKPISYVADGKFVTV